MKSIFYFCIVKSCKRHEVAANEQRFLCPNFIIKNIKRKEWGQSNLPEVSAYMNLTAPIALSLLFKFM